MDDLFGLIVDDRERCPQRFMTPHELIQTPLQGGQVQRAGQPLRTRNVIERGSRLELIQEPEPLLSEGEEGGAGLGTARYAVTAGCPRLFYGELQLDEGAFLWRKIGEFILQVQHFSSRFVGASLDTNYKSGILLRSARASSSESCSTSA